MTQDKSEKVTEVVKSQFDIDNLSQLNREPEIYDEEIKQLWIRTALILQEKDTIAAYFEEYPALKRSTGIELLLLDFERLHKIDQNIFIKEWPKMAKKVLQKAAVLEVCKDFFTIESMGIVNYTELIYRINLACIFRCYGGHFGFICFALFVQTSLRPPKKQRVSRSLEDRKTRDRRGIYLQSSSLKKLS